MAWCLILSSLFVDHIRFDVEISLRLWTRDVFGLQLKSLP